MENKNLNKLLFKAARTNNLKVAKLLILELAKLLIKKGADVNSKNEWGDTPLDEAARYDSLEVAELLIKHGGK